MSAAPETDADHRYNEAMHKLRELTRDLWWELDKIVGRRLCEREQYTLRHLVIGLHTPDSWPSIVHPVTTDGAPVDLPVWHHDYCLAGSMEARHEGRDTEAQWWAERARESFERAIA